jgi:hypothetical protein
MNTKIGYMHAYFDKSEYEGQEAIRVRSEMVMEIRRIGSSVRLSRTKVSFMRTDLTPLYFKSISNETGEDKIVEGILSGKIATIKITLNAQTTQRQESIPEGVIFEEMLGLTAFENFERGVKIGAKYTTNVFNLELLKPIKTRVEVVKEEVIDYQGAPLKVFVIDYLMELMGGIKMREWIGSDGITYKMQTDAAGASMMMLKTDMNDALGEVGELDVIINTRILVKGDQPLPNSSHFRAKVSLSKGEVKKTIMQTERQRLTAAEGASDGILEINRDDLSRLKTLPLPINQEKVSKYLKPTVYVQSEDEAIKAQAKEIAKGETDSWKVAQSLCHWVHQAIRDKNLSVGFGSAKQTLQALKGDCTEHTVLFIALARSIGIPARICAGITYYNDAFYYHFWPEVYVGAWVAMDPTLGQIQADATHIQLAGGTLESDSAVEYGEGVIRTLDRLQIEKIE